MRESPQGNRQQALRQLAEFLPKAAKYRAERNLVVPGHGHVSRLSPALRHRLILEQEVVDATLERYAFGSVEKFVQEVLWRTYWKGWLELRPQVWADYRQQLRVWRQQENSPIWERVKAVSAGRSGVAIMDRFACELIETGYLHNHARMWWASFWVHVERLPWQLGADFFFRHLLDADPASNTLSWRWVAGLQTVGKSYLVRESNLRRYCPSEWLEDSEGLDRLSDSVVAPAMVEDDCELRPDPEEWEMESMEEPKGRLGLWVHPDDLTLELGECAGLPITSVAAFAVPQAYEAMGLSSLRQAHLAEALEDGALRAAAHFGCEAVYRPCEHQAAAIGNWARERDLDCVVAFAPFVGPVADGVAEVLRFLRNQGIAVHWRRRAWDAQFFPYARKGFFQFWKLASRELNAIKSG